jgi:hypothetical protein
VFKHAVAFEPGQCTFSPFHCPGERLHDLQQMFLLSGRRNAGEVHWDLGRNKHRTPP